MAQKQGHRTTKRKHLHTNRGNEGVLEDYYNLISYHLLLFIVLSSGGVSRCHTRGLVKGKCRFPLVLQKFTSGEGVNDWGTFGKPRAAMRLT